MLTSRAQSAKGRIPLACSQPIVFGLETRVLASPRETYPNHHVVLSLRGSSSAMFSKYLLPYRSAPMKVPALVSPVVATGSVGAVPTRQV